MIEPIYPPIKARKVTRFYAAYVSTGQGNVCFKSFGSKMAAAKFLAKQLLLDELFGPKQHHSAPIDDCGNEHHSWVRPGAYAISVDEMRKFMAERFPPYVDPESGEPQCGCQEGTFCGHTFNRRLHEIVTERNLLNPDHTI